MVMCGSCELFSAVATTTEMLQYFPRVMELLKVCVCACACACVCMHVPVWVCVVHKHIIAYFFSAGLSVFTDREEYFYVTSTSH